MNTAQWKAWFYAGLAAFSLGCAYSYFYHPALLNWLTREDSLAESLSAACYLVAAGIFFLQWARCGFRNIFLLGYAMLFLLVGGEEINWGQRILGLQTPDSLNAVNVQNQINLHNIDGIHQHVRKAGLLVILAIGVLMPLSRHWMGRLRALYARYGIPVTPLWTIPVTLLAILSMSTPRLLWKETIFSIDEIGELYLSFTFLFFAFDVHLRSRVLIPAQVPEASRDIPGPARKPGTVG